MSGVDTALVYFGPTIANTSGNGNPTNLIDRLVQEGVPILGCAGGLMIEHSLVREHIVTMEETVDSSMGLSKDLFERLMSNLKAKLEV
jgi:hypothetical protein